MKEKYQLRIMNLLISERLFNEISDIISCLFFYVYTFLNLIYFHKLQLMILEYNSIYYNMILYNII